MNILYDDNMPYARECFAQLGNAVPFSAGELTANDFSDVEALLVRSTTTVDPNLLANATCLRYVATATAGFNHLDTAFLAARNIPWYAAAGCNAVAVAEYVISTLFGYASANKQGLKWLQQRSVGIVGAGHVGSALSSKLDALGISYQLCDPPLQASGDNRPFVSLDEILSCDVICLHVPLIKEGQYPTLNLLNKAHLSRLNEHQLIINACRGGVLDECAYADLSLQQKMPHLVLDAWKDEPHINLDMSTLCDIATPHIAGHTLEGKSRGTVMVYNWLCQQLGRQPILTLEDLLPPLDARTLTSDMLSDDGLIQSLIFSLYDSQQDDRIFRRAMAQSDDIGMTFTQLRKNYPQRREFAFQTLKVNTQVLGHPVIQTLRALGFTIQSI
ncbi:4-phosphoerythronate dehydrogenase [Alteromonas facilis]|uniref:4-phosphoerythronate dehydrogenase n=1 Tax=Alteromonas facilis TaxID=2048004 RepID=UPI000C290F19|nr:4-phosphoerythronate dehydrogenase [Alteromonas facilis]